MSASNTQSWLMNYEILRLVNQCRRLMDAEFGEKPLLSDRAIWQSLGELAGRSRSRGTQRVYAELRLALLKADDIDWPASHDPANDEPVPSQRMYRGRPVSKPAPAADAGEVLPQPVRAGSTRKTITYRGQTIEVA